MKTNNFHAGKHESGFTNMKLDPNPPNANIASSVLCGCNNVVTAANCLATLSGFITIVFGKG